ncbi:MAG: hypothetical protein R3Y33_00555 [Clostridia bacterium]
MKGQLTRAINGGLMERQEFVINDVKKEIFILEIKLAINKKLYDKNIISEEMYIKAKELILKS